MLRIVDGGAAVVADVSAAAQVYLADGPYSGQSFAIPVLENTLMIADVPIPAPFTGRRIDPDDPPVPMAVYELRTELIGPDGDREGTYFYSGHRYPRAAWRF
jgi:hypothetical protein